MERLQGLRGGTEGKGIGELAGKRNEKESGRKWRGWWGQEGKGQEVTENGLALEADGGGEERTPEAAGLSGARNHRRLL